MVSNSVGKRRWRSNYIEKLPIDIMVEILSRLPAKAVGKSRCVSKDWKSVLYDPNFIKLHLNRTKQASTDEVSLLLCDQDVGKLSIHRKPRYSVKLKLGLEYHTHVVAAKKLNFDGFDLPLFSYVITSCDGLVLFEAVKKQGLWLMNPTTMEITKLPPSSIPVPNSGLEIKHYGIGYDPSSDDYKVVSLEDCFIDIYSVKYGTWKRVEDVSASLFGGISRSGFCVNGRIHWLARDSSNTSYVVLTFDLETEKFHLMSPHNSFNPINIYCVTPSLGVLDGCLCLYYFRGEDNRGIDVYMMKEYGVQESWTKFHIKARDDQVFLIYPCLLSKQQLIMLKERGYPKCINSKEVVMYNMKEAGFKNVVLDGIPHNYAITQGHVYAESLVSPHHRNGGGGTTKA